MGENIEITPDSLATVEKLVIKLYRASVNTINKARYVLFCQKQTTGESLPPTDDGLKFHVMRVNYQLFIWKKALLAKLIIPPPTENGWHSEDDILVPTLIEREPTPNTLVEFTTCGCQKGCSRNYKCQKEDLPCTEACSCGADEDCRSPFSVQLIAENESDSDSDSENFKGDDE